MKKLIGFVAAATLIAVANADTGSSSAIQWGTIQPTGPRGATSGNRFLNAQGSSAGSNASDAPVRFDISSIKSQFDGTFGAGNWKVDAVSVLFDQANAFFSATGPVDMYHLEDDSIGITNGQAGDGPADDFSTLTASPLVYGDIPNSALLIGAETLVTDDFVYVNNGESAVVTDEYIVSAAALPVVAADILADDTLTFALVAGTTTAATYKGNDFDPRFRPQVVIEASLVPEPASFVLVALAGLLIRRR